MVRINSFRWDSKTWPKSSLRLPTSFLSQSRAPGQVTQVDNMIGELKVRHQINRPIWLMPILESGQGIENAAAIAAATESVVA